MAEVEENIHRANSETGILSIIDRAREEISWVHSVYKFAITLVAFLIAIGLYFSHRSFQDLKADLRDDGERIQHHIQAESELLARTLQKDLEDEITRVRGEVTARIDDEFKKDNISNLVSNQAQLRINAIADELIRAQISEQITPLKKDLTSLISTSSDELKIKVQKIDQNLTQTNKTEKELRILLTEARRAIASVNQQSQFFITFLMAQGDDRRAFEQLRQWARDDSYSLQQLAKTAEFNILKSHASFINDTHLLMNWVEGFDAKSMSFAEIQKTWNNLPSNYARDYVEFVWNNNNVTEEQKLSFLHDVLGDSRGSLQAAHWAAKTLSKEAQVSYNPPFDFSEIENWWSKRKQLNISQKDSTNNPMDNNKK